MKKQFVLLFDSETSMSDKVADFAATISDRAGNIVASYAVLIRGIYDDRVNHALFHNEDSAELWKMANLDRRYADYQVMLDSGQRMMASVGAVNNWLMMAKAQYDPVITAYNLPFDVDKCQKTGINLAAFDRRFCLWAACVTAYGSSRKYRQFILENHLFKPVTRYGNMSYPTNAETMARFVLGDINLPDEPHDALGDILGYEKPIMDRLLRQKSIKWLLHETKPYNWRSFQVKNHFKPL
jgi:hypothetical protein